MNERPLIPVEPLAERRWREIRSAVLDRTREGALDPAAMRSPAREEADRTPPWLRRASPALALVAVAAAVLLAVTHVNAPWIAGTSRVVTDGAPATASAGDVTLELSAHTSVLVVVLGPEQWLVSVEHGRVRCLVPPRGDRPSFSVEAGRTRAIVIGTTFSVAREPGAPSGEVVVEHGTVRVQDLAEEHLLHDGDRWPLLSAEPASAPETTAGDASCSAWAVEAAPGAHHDAAVAAHATRSIPHGVPSEETEAEAAEPSLVARLGPAAGAGAPVEHAPTTHAVSPTSMSTSDRYHAAEAMEMRDPAGALAIYATLAAEGGRWSAPALMAQARLAFEQHDQAQARVLCERYLAEQPDGINAEDARDLLGRMR